MTSTTTRRVTTLAVGMALAAGAGLAIGHTTTAQAEPEVRTVTKTQTVTLRDTSEIDRLTDTLHGQYDVNADYADTIADLRAKLADAEERADAAPKVVTKEVTKKVEVPAAPEFYEDGSWVAGDESGCAPSALCDDEYQEKYAAEHVADTQVDLSMIPSGSTSWGGFSVGEVILCPAGWSVSIDDADQEGWTWAACM